jgi:hypothetical protein
MVAEFLREKAAQCRTMAEGAGGDSATANGLYAMALEMEAQALAIEAGESTARSIEAVASESAVVNNASPHP